MRTLAAVCLLGTLSLCGGATEALACSTLGPRPTDIELFEQAHEVFVAKIIATKLERFGRHVCGDDVEDCTYVRGEYLLVENLKGNARKRGHVKDVVFGPGTCSLGLMAGWYYVFYVDAQQRTVLHPGGSFAVGPYPDATELDRLRAIRNLPHARPDEG